MGLSVLSRQDVSTMSTWLAALIDEDALTRNVANLAQRFGALLIDVVTWSTGQTPAFWIRWDGVNLYVIIGGANTLQQGLDLLGGALIPGVPLVVPHVNAAALMQANVVARKVNLLVPQFPANVTALGHSYGAAIATVLVAGWVQLLAGIRFQLFTQGCPRCGDIRLAGVLDQVPKLRVMNLGDPIPHFPPNFAEAPYATIALGPLQAQNLSYWAQTGGGAVLQSDGSLTPGELSPGFLGFSDVVIAGWAAGVNGFASTEHNYLTYKARLALGAATTVAPPVDPSPAGLKGEYVFPLTPADLAAGPVLGPLLQEGRGNVAFQSVFIPVAYRWKPVRVGSVWYATWQNSQVVACQSHSQAKSICKAFNKGLKVLQNASSVSRGLMQSTWTSYLAAASSSTTGFNPVLTVLP